MYGQTCGSTWPGLRCWLRSSVGVVGAFISHRRGIYYALLTIAFGQVFWFIAIKWHSVTGGEDGLLNLKRLPAQFGFASVEMRSNEAVFYLTLVLLLAVVYFCWRFVHSPQGRLLQCIKQNEMRAGFLGYRVWYYKWLVFALSAGIAGLAGALFAMAQNSAYPNVMSLHQSGFVVMMVLIGGGLTSFWGPSGRRGVLHSRPRPPGCVHRNVAVLVRPAVHGDRDVQARGAHRHRP